MYQRILLRIENISRRLLIGNMLMGVSVVELIALLLQRAECFTGMFDVLSEATFLGEWWLYCLLFLFGSAFFLKNDIALVN